MTTALRRFLIASWALAVTAAALFGAPIERPDEAMRLYFLESNGALYEERVAERRGEMPTRPTFGESIPQDSARIAYRLLEQDSTRAVFAVRVELADEGIDIYTFVEKLSGGWYIAALRALALTGIPQMVVDSVADPSQLPIAQRQIYENCKLVISSDDQLKKYFLEHQGQIERLYQLLLQAETGDRFRCEISISPSDDDTVAMTEGDLLLCDLNLSFAKLRDDGTAAISIGGMVDNEVGYLFVPEGAQPPRMDPSEYIYVERIVGRWYIYKTT